MPTKGILIPQDYQMPEDTKGNRKKVRAEDLRSGTLYGQYQLRGSVLTIKDASTTASGFMSFGTDMTTIPTSATSGTGIYIDYTGIYGLASNVQQAYMSAADGKIYAGAGAVTLGDTGITLGLGESADWIQWGSGQASMNAYQTGTETAWWSAAIGDATYYEATAGISAISNGGTAASVYAHAQDSGGFGDANLKGTATAFLTMIGDGSTVGYGRFYTKTGVSISNVAQTNASSLLHLSSTAPTFRMEDTTASAKSLLVTTDANKTKFEEAGGAANDLLVLDLANARVGIGTASPAIAKLSFGSGLGDKIALWEDGSSILGFGIQSALFQIYAGASTDRVGIGYGSSSSFTETLTVKSSGVGIGSTSPSASTLTLGDAYNIVVNTTTGTKIGTGTTQKLGFWNATPVVQNTGWGSITNVTTDRAYDANATTTDELADVLGTLIAQLVTYGILGA